MSQCFLYGIIFIVERRGTVPVPKDDGANEISNDNDMSPEILGGDASRPPLPSPSRAIHDLPKVHNSIRAAGSE